MDRGRGGSSLRSPRSFSYDLLALWPCFSASALQERHNPCFGLHWAVPMPQRKPTSARLSQRPAHGGDGEPRHLSKQYPPTGSAFAGFLTDRGSASRSRRAQQPPAMKRGASWGLSGGRLLSRRSGRDRQAHPGMPSADVARLIDHLPEELSAAVGLCRRSRPGRCRELPNTGKDRRSTEPESLRPPPPPPPPAFGRHDRAERLRAQDRAWRWSFLRHRGPGTSSESSRAALLLCRRRRRSSGHETDSSARVEWIRRRSRAGRLHNLWRYRRHEENSCRVIPSMTSSTSSIRGDRRRLPPGRLASDDASSAP